MPIRWKALEVSEAVDKVEEKAKLLIPPAKEAILIIEEALELPNLPQYVTQHLVSMASEFNDIIGYTATWNNTFQKGKIFRSIDTIRQDLPADALAQERSRRSMGKIESLL